jgi:SpoVK/Ycf46/Vps4 family AAA+-type ATPase
MSREVTVGCVVPCRTPGFTGADLQNLMNEAAILAARRDLKEISKEEIADALERIIAGQLRASRGQPLLLSTAVVCLVGVLLSTCMVSVHGLRSHPATLLRVCSCCHASKALPP